MPSKEVKSQILDLANKYLAEIDPPVLPESPAPEIQSNDVKALACAVEQALTNILAQIDGQFTEINTALMTIGKLGITKH